MSWKSTFETAIRRKSDSNGEPLPSVPPDQHHATLDVVARLLADPEVDDRTRKVALDALHKMAWQAPESREAVFESMRAFWRQGLLEKQRDGRYWLIRKLLERRDWAEVDLVVGDDPESQVILDGELLQLVRGGDMLDGAADLLGRRLPERTVMALWRAKREPERIADYLMSLADHHQAALGLSGDGPVVSDVIALLVERAEERDAPRARKALEILADLGAMTTNATAYVDIRSAAPVARRLLADPPFAEAALAVLAEVDPEAVVVTMSELASRLSPVASSWLARHLINGLSRIGDRPGSSHSPVALEVRVALREVIRHHPDTLVRNRGTIVLGVLARSTADAEDVAALSSQLSDPQCSLEALAALCAIASAGRDISAAEQLVSSWLANAPDSAEGGSHAGLVLGEIARRRREPLSAKPRERLWSCTGDESFGEQADEVLAAIGVYDRETAAWVAEAERRRAKRPS